MRPEDIHNTDADAYGMAVSVSLRTLTEIMTDANENTNYRIWAAEAVLENPPKFSKKKSAKPVGDQ